MPPVAAVKPAKSNQHGQLCFLCAVVSHFPHLLMVPLSAKDRLWQTGLAGAIPAAICYVLASAFLFAAAKCVFSSRAAGATAAALLAFNPNLLYLQSTPMNEPIFLATLMALLYCT